MKDQMQKPTQSEMIRQTFEIATKIDHDFYGNGQLGVKTKVDRLWVGARLMMWLAAAVFTALLAVTLK